MLLKGHSAEFDWLMSPNRPSGILDKLRCYKLVFVIIIIQLKLSSALCGTTLSSCHSTVLRQRDLCHNRKLGARVNTLCSPHSSIHLLF